MTITNDKATLKRKIITLILTIVATGMIALLLFTELGDSPVLGQERNTWILLIVILYLLYLGYHYMMNYYFFYYSDSHNKLLFRFYPVLSISPERKAIEIPKKDFDHYEITKSFFDRKGKILLYQQMPQGLARYPALSITLLSKEEKQKLFESLDQYSSKPKEK